jgi:hypothetical protein
MTSLLPFALVGSLLPSALSAAPLASTPEEGDQIVDQSGALSDLDWAELRLLARGTDVLVTVRGAGPSPRVLVRSTEAELVVMNLTNPAITRTVRGVLRELLSEHPNDIPDADGKATFSRGDVTVGPEGVFVKGRQLLDRAQVVEHLTRNALVSVVVIAAESYQQQTVRSFSELMTLVKKGESLIVTDANGKATRGQLAELTASSLDLVVVKEESDGRRTRIPQPRQAERDVRRIEVIRGDSLWNGALIGGGSATLFGFLVLASAGDPHGFSCLSSCAVPVVLGLGGAGIGLLIDAAITHRITIYDGSSHSSRPPSTLQIAPIVSQHGVGALFSVRF